MLTQFSACTKCTTMYGKRILKGGIYFSSVGSLPNYKLHSNIFKCIHNIVLDVLSKHIEDGIYMERGNYKEKWFDGMLVVV